MFKTQTKCIHSSDQLKNQFDQLSPEELQHGDSDTLLNRQLTIIKHELNLTQTDTLLDIGCGNGQHLGKLSDIIFKGLGVDWSENMIHIAKTSYPSSNLLFQQCSAEELSTLPEQSYSKICTIGAFEHFSDHRTICNTIYSLLKNNGKFLIITQNKSVLWHRLTPFFKRGLNHFSTDTFFSETELVQLLSDHGFQSITVGYYKFIPEKDICFPFNQIFKGLQFMFGKYLPKILKGGIYVSGTR